VARFLFDVTAELETHRGQNFCREFVFAARREALVQSGAVDVKPLLSDRFPIERFADKILPSAGAGKAITGAFLSATPEPRCSPVLHVLKLGIPVFDVLVVRHGGREEWHVGRAGNPVCRNHRHAVAPGSRDAMLPIDQVVEAW